jgi:hypothetical protein
VQPDVVHVDADAARRRIVAAASSTPVSMVRASVPWSLNAAMVTRAGC